MMPIVKHIQDNSRSFLMIPIVKHIQEDFDDANSKAYPRQFKKFLMIPTVKHIQDNSRRF